MNDKVQDALDTATVNLLRQGLTDEEFSRQKARIEQVRQLNDDVRVEPKRVDQG